MKNAMYFKMAKNNLMKNKKTYLPYIIASIGTIVMFYILDCMSINEGLNNIRGAAALKMLLSAGVKIIGLFSIIFLFYTNSFLIKKRKKEIGLYNVLGLEKKHIGKILSFETLIIASISLIIGIALGCIFGKVLFLILINVLKLDISISSSFSISSSAVKTTLFVFVPIFMAILFKNILVIKVNNPIELLKGGETGEKEPKAEWISAIFAFGCTFAGYYMAVSVNNPLKALSIIFMAVVLVIVGTYFLFISGSIVILKLLKNNKRFYYKSKNFISISGMIYRMKQNAVGLASICILCTAVLITVSTTVSLYAGQEGSLKIKYPYDTKITVPVSETETYADVKKNLNSKASDYNIRLQDLKEATEYELMVYINDNNIKTAKREKDEGVDGLSTIHLYSLYDYNKIEGKSLQLNDNEVLVFSVGKEFEKDSIVINGMEFNIVNKLDNLNLVSKNNNTIIDEYCIIFKGQELMDEVCKDALNTRSLLQTYDMRFNLDGNSEDKIKFCEALGSDIVQVDNIDVDRDSFYITNGGFIFLGCFLGILFILGTVLIIYYKQISEGYDDKGRFQIMKKVGMSKEEIKKVINKQVLMVFFFPLAIAITHTAFAHNIMSKLLGLFGLFDKKVFLLVTVITALIFILLYVIVYYITSNVYYKVVKEE